MRPDPTNLGFYRKKKTRMSALPRGSKTKAHKLYPDIATVTVVSLGIGISVYTLPEIPTIGFVRGRTSSCAVVRLISVKMGQTLKTSYIRSQLHFFLAWEYEQRSRRTLVMATKYGILSKSLAVKSASPLALTSARVSLISARSFCWRSGRLANSQSPKVSYRIREDYVQKEHSSRRKPNSFRRGFVSGKYNRPIHCERRDPAMRRNNAHRTWDMISSSVSLRSSRCETLVLTGETFSTIT